MGMKPFRMVFRLLCFVWKRLGKALAIDHQLPGAETIGKAVRGPLLSSKRKSSANKFLLLFCLVLSCLVFSSLFFRLGRANSRPN